MTSFRKTYPLGGYSRYPAWGAGRSLGHTIPQMASVCPIYRGGILPKEVQHDYNERY